MADTVTLAIRLSSGQFESSVTIPLDAAPEMKEQAIKGWLDLALSCLRNNVVEMAANFPTRDGGKE